MSRIPENEFIKVLSTNIPLGKGKLLVSAPLMTDDYFDRTVILLVEQGKNGSTGFILNRSMRVYLKDVMNLKSDKNFIIRNGGPVELNKLFFIHRYGSLISGAEYVGNQLYLGGSEKEIGQLLRDGLVDENNICFYVGYSSWYPGQLEKELDEKVWVVANFQENCVFSNENDLWREVVKSLGDSYTHWLDIPDKAYYN